MHASGGTGKLVSHREKARTGDRGGGKAVFEEAGRDCEPKRVATGPDFFANWRYSGMGARRMREGGVMASREALRRRCDWKILMVSYMRKFGCSVKGDDGGKGGSYLGENGVGPWS